MNLLDRYHERINQQIKTVEETQYDNIVAVAAASGKKGTLMISNSSKKNFKISLELNGIPGTPEMYMISKKHLFDKVNFEKEFVMPGHSVVLIEFNSEGLKKGKSVEIKGNFAGLDGVEKK